MEQTPPEPLEVVLAEVLDELHRLPADAPPGELICLGSRLGSALAGAAAAGTRLTGPSARSVAAALGQLAGAFNKAGLLPEADQIPRDPASDKCWADSWQELTGSYVPCSNDASTNIGLCAAHIRQLQSL